MKKLIYLSLLIVLFFFATTSKLQAETYRGESCWQVSGGDNWVYKFGVYEKEGGHYELYGTDDDGEGDITAAHGNAEVVGSNIKMTIVASGYEAGYGAWDETFNAVLSISTLSGTWHALGLVYDDSGSRLPYHTTGTITRITCP